MKFKIVALVLHGAKQANKEKSLPYHIPNDDILYKRERHKQVSDTENSINMWDILHYISS